MGVSQWFVRTRVYDGGFVGGMAAEDSFHYTPKFRPEAEVRPFAT
jgi:hypothetical protein